MVGGSRTGRAGAGRSPRSGLTRRSRRVETPAHPLRLQCGSDSIMPSVRAPLRAPGAFSVALIRVRPRGRRRRLRGVRARPAARSLRRLPVRRILSRPARVHAGAAARAPGRDRRADHGLGRMESEARHRGLPRAGPGARRRGAAARAARSRADRRVDVAAVARAAPEGARHRPPAARDPARPRRHPARGGNRDRSGADDRRSGAHRVDPAAAGDRDPRRADHLGRRPAQCAAARPRSRPVPAGEPVRPPSLRAQGHAAGRACVAARPARRFHGRVAEGLGEGGRSPVRAARLRRRRRVARMAAAAGADRQRQGRAAHLVPVRGRRGTRGHRRPRARRRRGQARGRAPRAPPRAPLGARRLAELGQGAGDLHARSGLRHDRRRASRSDEFHACVLRGDAQVPRPRGRSSSTSCSSSRSWHSARTCRWPSGFARTSPVSRRAARSRTAVAAGRDRRTPRRRSRPPPSSASSA